MTLFNFFLDHCFFHPDRDSLFIVQNFIEIDVILNLGVVYSDKFDF